MTEMQFFLAMGCLDYGNKIMPKQVPMLDCAFFAVPIAKANFLCAEENIKLIATLRPHSKMFYVCVAEGLDVSNDFSDFCESNNIVILKCRGDLNRLNYYAQGLSEFKSSGRLADKDVLFCDTSLIGPLVSLDNILNYRTSLKLDVASAFTFRTNIDSRFLSYRDALKEFFETNWLQVSPEVANDEQFSQILDTLSRNGRQINLVDAEVKFALSLVEKGYGCKGFDQSFDLISSAPQLYEADKLVRVGHPFIHRDILNIDPLIYEMQTIDGRKIIDAVEQFSDFDIDLLWSIILRDATLRDVATRFNELNLIDDAPKQRTQKNCFSKVVLVVHVYYTDFIHEVVTYFSDMPNGSHLWISVSSEDGKHIVEGILRERQIENFKIKVVKQNRGRDMSSLFITFRDEFLKGDVDLALRLHSKKTPQVPPHVSASFRAHLIDNLIPNRNYVENILELFNQNKSIGMAVPPTIHIGFGTLGHAWFANKEGAQRLVERLKLNVKLDVNTPVAAYGTMFWFRPKALEEMFIEEWSWNEFNAEPNHIDGGLAHIMERLMGYVAQSNGYRVTQVVGAKPLIANYVKLEYKLQRLASNFPSGDIREQVRLADFTFGPSSNFLSRSQSRFWFAWVAQRTKIKRRHPVFWEKLRPILKILRTIFIDLPQRRKFRRNKKL